MRDCQNCKHLIMYDYKNKSYSCEKWECKFEPKEQEPTTKNDLGVDCISRKAVLDELGKWDWQELYLPIHFKENIVDVIPSVTPQEPILDKIRAEISIVYESLDGYDPDSLGAFVSKIDEIFDRYKADREALADIYKPTLKADLCIMDEFAFMPKAEREAEDGTNE